jgi:hypothetical protein
MFRFSVEGGLEQFIFNSQAVAFMRGWYQPSPGGASLQIVAMAFTDPSYPARVMAAYKYIYARRSSFNVPGIAGAIGFNVPAFGSGTPIPESDVMFSKGKTLYLVVAAAQSGKADAIKVAKAQFTNTTSHHG